MKTSFSILTIILISLCQLYAREGDKVLNGGEPCEDRIEMIRDDIKQWIHDNGHLGLELGSTITHTQYANRMKSAFDSITSIRCSEQLETIGPTPKTCTNGIDQHGTAFIRCNRQRFISDSTEEEQYRLIHHEYASYSNLEKSNNSISNYSISNQITAFLEWQLVKKLAVKKYTDKLFWSGSEMCIVKKNRPLYCWGHDTDPRLNRLSIDNLSSIGVGVNTTCVYFKDQEEV